MDLLCKYIEVYQECKERGNCNGCPLLHTTDEGMSECISMIASGVYPFQYDFDRLIGCKIIVDINVNL